jgi:fused signal recognition particle receptor
VVDSNLMLVLLAVLLVVVATVAFVYFRGRSAGSSAPGAGTGVAVREPKGRGLRVKLARTRSALSERLASILTRDNLDAEFWNDLEDTLVAADVGVETSAQIVAAVRSRGPEDGAAARLDLEAVIVDMLDDKDRSLHLSGDPAVILVVGVNGTGKTTSIAKLASQLTAEGHRVLLAAADTFRAAADEQLKAWAARVGVPVVSAASGTDPASVAHDGYTRARREGFDVLIVDTAGRLHSKSNLMDELTKVGRVLRREAGDLDEVLLVLDGTTGQNGIHQAHSFTTSVGVTGIVLTKLDGTSRGGVVIAVEEDLDIPVKYIGVGEGVGDLIPFDPTEFVEALLEP